MNKQELVAAMAENTNFTKKDCGIALNGFIKSVEDALASGDKVQIIGFGTFDVRDRAAREGRNPRNPEEIIQIPESKAAVFKAGKTLKAIING